MRILRHVLLVGMLGGCASDQPPPCVAVDTSCPPGYVPTFANVYNNTLRQSCGSTRSSCHSASGNAGGLSFENEDTAHAQLLEQGRVKPGDAACSEMIVRTSSPGETYQMPPGDALAPAARCALIQWVHQGALR